MSRRITCGKIMNVMEISYLGHACFKIKTKSGVVVMDPYGAKTGLKLPSVSADIVTVSHSHDDHNNVEGVVGTVRRKEPFAITDSGEYEVEGISIFGYQTSHDQKNGEERGENVIFVVQTEDLRVLHLGDLGHELTEKLLDELNGIDVLMVPVGGVYTIDPETAVKVIEAIEPTFVLPMHYQTPSHNKETFKDMADVAKFTALYGHNTRTVKSLNITKLSLPQDVTEVIVFE